VEALTSRARDTQLIQRVQDGENAIYVVSTGSPSASQRLAVEIRLDIR
jgi:hypothetical protein